MVTKFIGISISLEGHDGYASVSVNSRVYILYRPSAVLDYLNTTDKRLRRGKRQELRQFTVD